MDSLYYIIIFLSGLVIGSLLTYIYSSKKTNRDNNSEYITNVKELIQNLSNQISIRDGKDDERYEVINKITSAFTGNTKRQGTVGEILLLNILQQAGLREGKDFETQKKFDNEVDGDLKRKYPDVILHLPNDRDIIIDSKLSLTGWMDYCGANNEEEKKEAHKRHIQSIRNHIKKLSESNYQKIFDIKTLDSVIMFMPYESSFESMLDKIEDIILEANRCKVILASPSTLISVLKIIENMWSINERNKNADLIASTAIEIYAQVEKVHSAFENAGNELQKSMSSVENAKLRLRDGRGSLVSRVKKMMKLGGLKPDKEIPDYTDDQSGKIKKIN